MAEPEGVFISYRREDSAAQAGRLFDRISDRFGEDFVFMDVDSIELGADFFRAIDTALSHCKVLLAVIGPRWLDSADDRGQRRIDNPRDLVRVEIETALRRGIRVIPVLIDGAVLPSVDQLPAGLSDLVHRQAVEISHGRFRSDSLNLVNGLERVVGQPRGDSLPTVPPVNAVPPISATWWATVAGVGQTRVFTVQLSEQIHSVEVKSGQIFWIVALDGEVILRRHDWKSELSFSFPISDGAVTRHADLWVKIPVLSDGFKRIRLAVDNYVLHDGPVG